MSKNKKEGSLDVPIFQYINEKLQSDFSINRNELGMSDIHFGMKKTIISKLYEIENPPNMSMLFGTIIHQLIEYKPIRTAIVDTINKQLGLKCDPISRAEKEAYFEILPGKKIRLHPDISTPHYIIEIKTTGMPVKKWNREVASYHVSQLNGYTGYFERKGGILLMINTNAFMTSSGNWEYIFNNYAYFLPFKHNPPQYQNTLNRAKYLFKCIDEENIEVKCPEFEWECTHCPPNIQEICGKESYNCQDYNEDKEKKCNKKMLEHPNELTGKFTDSPLCETCFQRIYPHSKYEKWKYLNYSKKS